MATATVKVYRTGKYLGTGTGNTATNTIVSYSGEAPGVRRNLSITLTTGTRAGETYKARVVTDGGATLTLNQPMPYA